MDAHEYGMRPRYRGPSMGVVVLVAILFGIVAGFGGTVGALYAYQHGMLTGVLGPVTTTTSDTGTVAPVLATVSPQQTFAKVAEQMNQSVVNINTLSHQENPYSFFFGGGPQVVKGLGTGVIVDAKEGLILTNYHVAGDADNITVTVMHPSGKQEYKAEFIGGDKQEDLALIKIKAPGLKAVRFGDSDKLLPGDWVMAIGNPFGFEHTVSVGVVSALNRRLPVDEAVTLRGMIQTDASINPGNSGGPLVSLNGEVIGINTAIYVGQGSGQPQASGIGFSIPSNRVVKIMAILRNHKKIEHPYIGIRYEAITDEVRREERLPVKDGVIIRNVYPKGPADKAGLKADDIIIAADGKALRDVDMLADLIGQKEVGARLPLEIQRWDDQQGGWVKKSITVKIEDMPKEFLQSQEKAQEQPQQDEQPNNNNQRNTPFPWPF